MSPAEDEFYVGYEAAMPRAIGVVVGTVVSTAVVVALVAAASVAALQRPLPPSSFAYGVTATWSGYLVREPAPMLLVPAADGFARYWLVGRGKRGATAVLAGVGAGWIQVRGSAIAREPWQMIEVAEARPVPMPTGTPSIPAATAAPPHAVRLRGEIVDSKCFLGVMNPGERTVHRDCAVRCLSGGVTPMLHFIDDTGRSQLAVIVDGEGTLIAPGRLGPVGRPTELAGALHTVNDVLVLRVAGGREGRP